MDACPSIQCDFKISQSRHSSKTAEFAGDWKLAAKTWLSRHELSYVWAHPNSPSSRISATQLMYWCLHTGLLTFWWSLPRSGAHSFTLTAEPNTSAIKIHLVDEMISWSVVFRCILIIVAIILLKKVSSSSISSFLWICKRTTRDAATFMRLHCVFWNNAYSEWMNRDFQCNLEDLPQYLTPTFRFCLILRNIKVL